MERSSSARSCQYLGSLMKGWVKVITLSGYTLQLLPTVYRLYEIVHDPQNIMIEEYLSGVNGRRLWLGQRRSPASRTPMREALTARARLPMLTVNDAREPDAGATRIESWVGVCR
ncbi:hypothetical protein ACVWYH_002246 [Bradyrhizobium sp. GM24.11]